MRRRAVAFPQARLVDVIESGLPVTVTVESGIASRGRIVFPPGLSRLSADVVCRGGVSIVSPISLGLAHGKTRPEFQSVSECFRESFGNAAYPSRLKRSPWADERGEKIA